jgi:hypothetical protein
MMSLNHLVKKQLERFVALVLLAFLSMAVCAEDIDIFANGLTQSATEDSAPNIIFVLDNTSNWSRQNQQWPARNVNGVVVNEDQGQAQVAAIKAALGALGGGINVAILEFTTDGNANDNGGYVRFGLQPYDANRVNAVLDQIYQNTNSPTEKRNSGTEYGNLIADLHNYLAGSRQTQEGAGTPSDLADPSAYSSQWAQFSAPLTQDDICSQTYVIFIGNPNASGPANDDLENSNRLSQLYSSAGETPAKLAGTSTGDTLLMQRFSETKQGGSEIEVGYTKQCYAKVKDCTDAINGNSAESSAIQAACPGGGTCQCVDKTGLNENVDGDECPFKMSGKNKRYSGQSYLVVDEQTGAQMSATGIFDVDSTPYNLDDWTDYLHRYGVQIPYACAGEDGAPSTCYFRIPVTTYTLDVFNAQPNVEHSSLMDSAARLGGGYRLEANSYEEIRAALDQVFSDIISVNSSFAAVTLPLSSTNRAQSENKVFVGMFRPAKDRKPRWMGNLKYYQLQIFNGQPELADQLGARAINPQTGFASACASSFWTTDTSSVPKGDNTVGPYFDGLNLDPEPISECSIDLLGERSVWSDDPDGAFVEKGGVAQKIRENVDANNNPLRNIFTLGTNALATLSSSAFSAEALYDYVMGSEPGLVGGDLKVSTDDGQSFVANPDLGTPEVMPYTGLRVTLHGDVVHSRPLTVSYGPKPDGSTNFRIFYGANDGLYRSINPDTAVEDWAFIAPEHIAGIERQYRNTPTIAYTGLSSALSTDIDALPKDYFFDGSTGVFTRYGADQYLVDGYIFPTMRRGGRLVYALDISPDQSGAPPTQPGFLWRAGCPNDDNDIGCTNGWSQLGQTWSTPVLGTVKSYVGSGSDGSPDPVLIMGGGWDDCLDEDAATAISGCTKGNIVYVVNAKTGVILKTFETEFPVPAEVEPIDIDADGHVDFVYVADAGGRLYRLSFGTLESEIALSVTPATGVSEWRFRKIAQVDTSRRAVRFMNKPVAGSFRNTVYITLGSGDRERPLKQNYPYQSDVQNRFYAFIDRPYDYDIDGDGTIASDERVATRVAINLDSAAAMIDMNEGLPDGESITDYWGWFFDLADRGEQVVNPSALAGGRVFFNTFQPVGQTNAAVCADLGTAKGYSLPLFIPDPTDVQDTFIVGGGIPIPPVIATVLIEGPNGEPDPRTVCIGCQGFDPIEIEPQVDSTMREAYMSESIDTD